MGRTLLILVLLMTPWAVRADALGDCAATLDQDTDCALRIAEDILGDRAYRFVEIAESLAERGDIPSANKVYGLAKVPEHWLAVDTAIMASLFKTDGEAVANLFRESFPLNDVRRRNIDYSFALELVAQHLPDHPEKALEALRSAELEPAYRVAPRARIIRLLASRGDMAGAIKQFEIALDEEADGSASDVPTGVSYGLGGYGLSSPIWLQADGIRLAAGHAIVVALVRGDDAGAAMMAEAIADFEHWREWVVLAIQKFEFGRDQRADFDAVHRFADGIEAPELANAMRAFAAIAAVRERKNSAALAIYESLPPAERWSPALVTEFLFSLAIAGGLNDARRLTDDLARTNPDRNLWFRDELVRYAVWGHARRGEFDDIVAQARLIENAEFRDSVILGAVAFSYGSDSELDLDRSMELIGMIVNPRDRLRLIPRVIGTLPPGQPLRALDDSPFSRSEIARVRPAVRLEAAVRTKDWATVRRLFSGSGRPALRYTDLRWIAEQCFGGGKVELGILVTEEIGDEGERDRLYLAAGRSLIDYERPADALLLGQRMTRPENAAQLALEVWASQ